VDGVVVHQLLHKKAVAVMVGHLMSVTVSDLQEQQTLAAVEVVQQVLRTLAAEQQAVRVLL
jgi:hypothetical protein